jgi:hypothetical protein
MGWMHRPFCFKRKHGKFGQYQKIDQPVAAAWSKQEQSLYAVYTIHVWNLMGGYAQLGLSVCKASR